jgi:hypothetical protein
MTLIFGANSGRRTLLEDESDRNVVATSLFSGRGFFDLNCQSKQASHLSVGGLLLEMAREPALTQTMLFFYEGDADDNNFDDFATTVLHQRVSDRGSSRQDLRPD